MGAELPCLGSPSLVRPGVGVATVVGGKRGARPPWFPLGALGRRMLTLCGPRLSTCFLPKAIQPSASLRGPISTHTAPPSQCWGFQGCRGHGFLQLTQS